MKYASALLAAYLLGQGWAASLEPAKQPLVLRPIVETVYITNSGDKFHASGCRYLRKSKIAVDRAEATKLGKTACKVCKP